MKSATLHTLITARVLLDDAVRLTDSDDRHLCTAGLIVLQDALELIFFALLTEIGADTEKNLESMSFDELVSELKKRGVPVLKSGKLKALNKQRVLSKHYGELAEATTVRSYVEAATAAVQAMAQKVLGKSINEVYLTELLDEGDSREFLTSAASLIVEGRFLDALIEIRKAVFVEIEEDYSIYFWKDGDPKSILRIFARGKKAPVCYQNKDWISANVKQPLEYVKVDSEKLRLDAMEWGVHTSDLTNILRLTPNVFRSKAGEEWHVGYSIEFPSNQANKANAHYCLDRAIAILVRKQQHQHAHKRPSLDGSFESPDIYIDQKVYSKADTASEVIHTIVGNDRFTVWEFLSGFNSVEKYYKVSGYIGGDVHSGEYLTGFILAEDPNRLETAPSIIPEN